MAERAGSGQPPRLVVLISGSGSNLQAILDAIASGALRAQVVAVFSNRADAYGLVRAAQAGVPTRVVQLRAHLRAGGSREGYDRGLAEQVAELLPDLVVLAGWMLILSPAFLDALQGRVINLHPALPGQFAGTHAIERAFEAYGRGEISGTGCMVHYVVPEVDAGPVIATAAVQILPEDRIEDLAARMHAAEHVTLVQAIRTATTHGGPPPGGDL